MTDLRTIKARAKLAPRGKPYFVATATPGISLGYRRLEGRAGSWTARLADGKGGNRFQVLGVADDLEQGAAVLTYEQAQDAARKVEQVAELTVDQALTNYATDLQARGGNVANASNIRFHMPAKLLPELLAKVTSKQFAEWRLALLQGGMKPATMNRLFKVVHAAFNLAAKHDDAVRENGQAWRAGLEFIAGANIARNAWLSDAQVRALVAAAYDLGEEFGVYVQAHAELGSRSDQINRITVGDVGDAIVMVPNSGKGRGKHKSRAGSTMVALAPDLAQRFNALAAGRAEDELLLTFKGQAWNKDRAKPLVARMAAAAKVEATLIAFRHSSIVRALRARVDPQTVADWHNTSLRMIQTNYARHARDTHVDLIRKALLNTAPMQNVVPLRA